MKTLHTLIAAALIAGSSAASAAEPVALNDAELDGVTAGANVLIVLGATAVAGATSVGPLAASLAETGTLTAGAAVDTGPFTHIAVGAAVAAANSVSAN